MYANDQTALWDAPTLEAAAARFDASVNITAADLAGVSAFTVADTVIGGALPRRRMLSGSHAHADPRRLPAGLFAAGRPCSPPNSFTTNTSAQQVAK